MRMTRRLLIGFGIAVVGAGVYAVHAAQAPQSVNLPAANLKWAPYAPGSPLEVAPLWGDRTKGEYAMLLKMPPNFEAGRHSHTADYHAVGVQGTWVHTNDGQRPVELAPGSYVMQPGKQIHNDQCRGTTPCIIMVHQHAAGDFIPASGPAPAAR